MILQLVAFTITRETLSGSEDLRYLIVLIRIRPEIDEGIVNIRFGGNTAICSISHLIQRIIIIIIISGTATYDIIHPTLCVLCISRNLLDLFIVGRINHILNFCTYATCEVRSIYRYTCRIVIDNATQVVSTIHIVANVWEASNDGFVFSLSYRPLANVGLYMAQDVGITTASEGVEDTTIAQVDVGITCNHTFESTTVKILTLCHVGAVALSILCNTREAGISIQVNIGAVSRVVCVC